MMRIRNTGLIIALVMIIALVIVNPMITQKLALSLRPQSDEVQRSFQVIDAISDLLSGITDAEMGQYGFMVTGEDAYLEPYAAGVSKAQASLSELTPLVESDPKHVGRMTALTLLLNSKLRDLDRAIEVRRSEGVDAAQGLVHSASSKRDLDGIRALLATMHDDEHKMLRDKFAVGGSTVRVAVLSTLITMLASLLLYSAAVLLIRRNIAARNAVATELGKQGDLLRTTLASIVEGVLVTDARGRITYLNPVAERLCDRSQSTAAGQALGAVLDLRDPHTNESVECGVPASLPEGSPASVAPLRRVLVARDGTRLEVEVVTAPLRGASGQMVGCVITLRDLTSQRRDEERVAKALTYAESIVDTVADPLVILDPDGRIRSANVAFYTLFRTSEARTIEHSIFALDAMRCDVGGLRSLLEGTSTPAAVDASLELECTILDGEIRILHLNARRLRGEVRHTDLILLAIRDVTRRRADERRLQQLLDSAQTNASRLREISSASLTINSAHSHERVIEVLRSEARRILEAASADVTFGSTAPAQTAGSLVSPLTGRDGVPLGWVQVNEASSGNSNAREQDEAMLRQLVNIASVAIENARLYEELRDGDRRKDEFLATLAHELRNPLAPVRSSVQILCMSEASQSEREQAVAMIERQVALLVRLVDDLLDVSRITRGKIALKQEVVELADVVARALEISRPIIDASGHKLTVRLPDRPTRLRVDGSRIAQVLANLLNNAAKYTDRGGNVLLACTVEGSEVTIRVSDDGMGIPPEVLPHIFTMFWQVEHPVERAQGGLGIGLTLVKQLVDLHGGRVEAHSAGVGRGSEFVVRLPLSKPSAASAATAAPTPRMRAPATSPARRILVVDDNVDSAQSLAILLRMQGHEVHTAHDGQEALATAERVDPELVLLDIGLPRIDGHEAARRLRARHGHRFKLVAMTGFGRAEDRKRSREAGFDHHLVKPVDPAVLTSILLDIGAPAS